MAAALKEAPVLLAFAMMPVVQGPRTERALEALRDLTNLRDLAIRDGQRKRVAGRDVVRGTGIAEAAATASIPATTHHPNGPNLAVKHDGSAHLYQTSLIYGHR
jgi:hypothetical protein